MQCDEVAQLLAGAVDGSAVLDVAATRHVSSCLRCQAELAQYRKLLRSLRSLRDEPVHAPGDLPALIQARLDATGRATSGWTRRVAYAGAVAATAAAGAGAIALVASRRGRLRLAS
ncbi:MAG TPA: hypothetical protein VMU14_19715 [Acidimicrobiales bacterium]|nr:hypothetical protein [Acidimicrobiales bacterium]